MVTNIINEFSMTQSKNAVLNSVKNRNIFRLQSCAKLCVI